MTEVLIERFETRINKTSKSSFLELLRGKGHFMRFCESTKSHIYAVTMLREELEGYIGKPLSFSGFHTVFVALKNGEFSVVSVD
jgi:hypothetical protein